MLIFWDLDDCLNHFTLDCLKHFGIDIGYPDFDPAWGRDIVKVANILGLKISSERFWSEVPYSVWAKCRPTELLDLAEGHILTAPVHDPRCTAGKVAWINKYWTGGRVIAEDKWLLASEGRVLFDDCNENIDAWRKHGGTGYLIPRPWNREAGKDPRSAVLNAFEEIIDNEVHL
jgi:hypothetical protein